MSGPLVVNLKDGSVWTRREATRDGVALYALTAMSECPEFVMATYAELEKHGIAGTADALPVPVGPKPAVTDDRAKAPWGRGEDGRPLLPLGAHWTDVPELVDRTVAGIQSRLDQAHSGHWHLALASEGRPSGTVRTNVDGYPRTVGQVTNMWPADLDLVLHAHADLSWCLEMIAKFRAWVAELEPAPATVYRAAHDSIVLGLYTTREAAQQHCEAKVQQEEPPGSIRHMSWVADDIGEDAEYELHITPAQTGALIRGTGYVVTPLEVASEYDEEADE